MAREIETIRIVNTAAKPPERKITLNAWNAMSPSKRKGWFRSDEPLSDLLATEKAEKAGLEEENAELRKRIAILDKTVQSLESKLQAEAAQDEATDVDAPETPTPKPAAKKKTTAKKK